jgi:hypothetical protein
MAANHDKLTQNVAAKMWSLLNFLRDLDFQRRQWAQGEDIHSFDDLINDFDIEVSGLEEWNFSQRIASLYRSYGIPFANLILPVYVAICECSAIDPVEPNDLAVFLESKEWLGVVNRARVAFDFIDQRITKGSDGLPLSYDPTTWEILS